MAFTRPLDCFCWAVIQNSGKHLLEDRARCESPPWWVEVCSSPTETAVVCVLSVFYSSGWGGCGGWGWAAFNGIVCLCWWLEALRGLWISASCPGQLTWLRLLPGLRGPRPVWQQEDVCRITRNGQISWPVSTSRFKPVNMDSSEPSKAECSRSDLLKRDLLMQRCRGAPSQAWLAGLSCGSCHAPARKGIAPTPQRRRSALI